MLIGALGLAAMRGLAGSGLLSVYTGTIVPAAKSAGQSTITSMSATEHWPRVALREAIPPAMVEGTPHAASGRTAANAASQKQREYEDAEGRSLEGHPLGLTPRFRSRRSASGPRVAFASLGRPGRPFRSRHEGVRLLGVPPGGIAPGPLTHAD